MAHFEKGTFVIVPNKHVLRGKDPQLQALYYWICNHANEMGECYPSYATLAEEAGVSVPTAIRRVKDMVDLGLLKKTVRPSEGDRNDTNIYQLMILPTPPWVSQGHPLGIRLTQELNPINSINSATSGETSETDALSPSSPTPLAERSEVRGVTVPTVGEKVLDTYEEEDTSVVPCDDEGNPLTPVGFVRKAKGDPNVTKVYNAIMEEGNKERVRRGLVPLITRVKQYSALKRLKDELGMDGPEIADAYEKMLGDDRWPGHGGDYHTLISYIEKGNL